LNLDTPTASVASFPTQNSKDRTDDITNNAWDVAKYLGDRITQAMLAGGNRQLTPGMVGVPARHSGVPEPSNTGAR
jgi:hypothetical protein